MKKYNFVTAVAVMVLGLSSIAAVSAADHKRGGPDHMLRKITHKLELTDTQKEVVGDLVKSRRDASKADIDRIAEIKKELKQQPANFDSDRALKLSNEMGEIMGRLAYQRTELMSLVYAQLDESQQAKMTEMLEREGKKKRNKKGGRGKSGHHDEGSDDNDEDEQE